MASRVWLLHSTFNMCSGCQLSRTCTAISEIRFESNHGVQLFQTFLIFNQESRAQGQSWRIDRWAGGDPDLSARTQMFSTDSSAYHKISSLVTNCGRLCSTDTNPRLMPCENEIFVLCLGLLLGINVPIASSCAGSMRFIHNPNTAGSSIDMN